MSWNFSFQIECCLLSLLLRTRLNWIRAGIPNILTQTHAHTHTANDPVELIIIFALHILRLFDVPLLLPSYFGMHFSFWYCYLIAFYPHEWCSLEVLILLPLFHFCVLFLFFFSISLFCYHFSVTMKLRLLNWKDAIEMKRRKRLNFICGRCTTFSMNIFICCIKKCNCKRFD